MISIFALDGVYKREKEREKKRIRKQLLNTLRMDPKWSSLAVGQLGQNWPPWGSSVFVKNSEPDVADLGPLSWGTVLCWWISSAFSESLCMPVFDGDEQSALIPKNPAPINVGNRL